MKNHLSIFKGLFITLSLASVTLKAQGFQVNLQGQKQQGMASAGSAFVQDESLLFYNPGSAAFVMKNGLNVGVSPTIPNTVYLDSATQIMSRTESPVSTPFAAYALFSPKDTSRFRIGLAVYTPFGSTVQWPSEWIGRFAITRLQLKTIFFQPTLSYQVTNRIGIGAGFVNAIGSVNLQKDIPVINSNGVYGRAELDGRANGYGFNIGIYIKPTKQLNLALSYRSQVNMKVKDGRANFYVPEGLAPNFPNGKFTSSLPLPQVFTFGTHYQLNEKINLVADINYVGWKAYDTLAFDYETNTTSLLDTKSPRLYENTFAFRLGGQYTVNEKFQFRAGAAYGISPVQQGYVTPETPDANRFIFTAGVSYLIATNLQVDASMYFTQFTRAAINYESNLRGTFKTAVLAPGISIRYQF
ncbi:MAG: OmpP1/FadL family transporter [Bacteroidota bacterium]|jgi:long-chain fatty acid transport protein